MGALAAGGDSMTDNVISRVRIADIEIVAGGRDLQDGKVSDLIASMQRIGMLNPIGVRMVAGEAAVAAEASVR